MSAELDSLLAQRLSQHNTDGLTTAAQAVLRRLLSGSSFIHRTLTQQPVLLAEFTEPKHLSAALQQQAEIRIQDVVMDEAAVFARLRQYRNAQLCRILAADILQLQSITTSLTQVSQLADQLINTAYQWAYQHLAGQWGTPLDSASQPMPLLILGMGKLGGAELNFSSDIDLIFTYPANGETQGGRRSCEHQQFFTRLGQKIIAVLHQVTADGFVYRVDMRLRPFGDSGPLVLSFAAMEDYYQEQGREWERYAMLKARVLNPDASHSQELQQLLRPFIYRRYIDFSAIESLRRMKQQIEQENRRLNRRDNIKLGAGGIREVEFVVQTLQLIRGGRIPALQQQSLLRSLEVLQQEQILTASQLQQLRDDYLWLRQVEQALQGLDDKQTQTLPQDELERAQLLAALQFDSWPLLQSRIDTAMQRIHQQFKQVIDSGEEADAQDVSLGKLIWDSEQTPAELAPQLDWLSEAEAIGLISQLQQFKQDCQRRSVGPRGRDYLAKLLPLLLHMLQQQHCQTAVLSRVLLVFGQIVTRTAYLELLFENSAALQQLVLLCNRSGWLAEQLARYPMLLDELIDPAQLYQIANQADYSARLRQHMLRVDSQDLELQMETLRQYKQAQQLRIAAADITGVMPLMKVSDHLSWLAEAMVAQVVELAWQQMTARYGTPEGCSDSEKGLAVIAYGKLGGLELGYGSDLDLVFVHSCSSQGVTDGERSIDAMQFYLKLVQRVLHLCTTRTSSGVLYEVDTRLRPSGNAGLLAIHIETYGEYLQQQAWTWEHQALVRARAIYGTTALCQRFAQIRQQIIGVSRQPQKLREDVVQMRHKLRQHHGATADDPKHSAGGIIDLEFISQYLVLAHGAVYPALYQYTDNIRILDAAAQAGLLAANEVLQLQQAYQLLRGAGHRQTLAPATLPAADELLQAKAVVEQVWQRLFNTAAT